METLKSHAVIVSDGRYYPGPSYKMRLLLWLMLRVFGVLVT